MSRVIILVMDSFGVGQAPDAHLFEDEGANTFVNLSGEFLKQTQHKMSLPQLTSLGLMNLTSQAFTPTTNNLSLPLSEIFEPKDLNASSIKGAYGYMAEISTGKDTPSGHWEMAGVPVLFDWDYFSNKAHSFDESLVDSINCATGTNGLLGNCHASGTDIIKKLGLKHLSSGLPICYTSADSVFQVAAHEEHFGLENLYQYCEQVRALLSDSNLNIGRVIARPFTGNSSDNFIRTGNRRDYAVLPPSTTVLEKFTQAGGHVISVGKISDIFAHQGISEQTKATGINALVDATISHIKTAKDNSIIFTNLVNFDQDFGHRRDPIGYGNALIDFDLRLEEIKSAMADSDILFLTADHGCDPTWHGSDHTREYVPIMCYHHNIKNVNLGERETFADLGQTIADIFSLKPMSYGTSFLSEIDF